MFPQPGGMFESSIAISIFPYKRCNVPRPGGMFGTSTAERESGRAPTWRQDWARHCHHVPLQRGIRDRKLGQCPVGMHLHPILPT